MFQMRWEIAAGLAVYLLTAAVMDLKTKTVSVKTAVIFGAMGTVMEIVWQAQGAGVWLGGFAPGLFLLLLSRLTGEAMGYGDGIAVMVCGSFLGFWGCTEVLLLALFLTCPFSLLMITVKKADRKKSMPFLPFLLAGYFIWLTAVFLQA